MFKIKLNKNSEIHDFYQEEGCFGYIRINDFNERFFSPTEFWSREEYLKNWYQELNKLLNGFSCAKLITKMYNPKYANYLQSYVFYLADENVFIREQFLFLGESPKQILLEDLYSKELIREIYNEEGKKISEWKCSKKDIEKALKYLGE